MKLQESPTTPISVELTIGELNAIYDSLEARVEALAGDMGAFAYEENPGDLAKDMAVRHALSARVWRIITYHGKSDNITNRDGEWECLCGNTANMDGFYPCDETGRTPPAPRPHVFDTLKTSQPGRW